MQFINQESLSLSSMLQMITFPEQDRTKKIYFFFSENFRNKAVKELSRLIPASEVHTTLTSLIIYLEEHVMDFMTVGSDILKFIISSYHL